MSKEFAYNICDKAENNTWAWHQKEQSLYLVFHSSGVREAWRDSCGEDEGWTLIYQKV